MYCIFYNDSTEISRLALQLSAGGFVLTQHNSENTTRILIRFQISGVGAAISVGDNYLTKRQEINKLSEWERQSIKRGTTVNTTAAVVYVDAVNGNDTNPGTTESAALATLPPHFPKQALIQQLYWIGGHDRTFEYQNQVKPTFRPSYR